jgi:phage-related minor tail protein
MPRFFVDIQARFAQMQDALNQVTKNTERSASQMANAFSGVKNAIVSVTGAISVGAFGRAIIESTKEAEQASIRLGAALRSTGGQVGLTKDQLDDLAESMKGLLGVDDEQVRRAQTTLIRFGNITGEVFKESLRLSADLSAALGIDMAEAAHTLGRAVQSPTEGLRNLEMQFGKLAPAQEKLINDLARQGRAIDAQREILKLYDEKIGGTAKEMNTGLTKATRDVTVAWDDFLKALGRTEGPMRFVREAFEGLAVALRAINEWVGKKPGVADEMGNMAEGVKALNKQIDELLQKRLKLSSEIVSPGQDPEKRKAQFDAIERDLQKHYEARKQFLEKFEDLNDRARAFARQAQEEQALAGAVLKPVQLGGGIKDTKEEQAFKRALESLQDQAAKLKNISVEEQTLADIRRGAYGELDAAQRRQLVNAARQIDLLRLQQQLAGETAKVMRDAAPQPLDVRYDELLKFWGHDLPRAAEHSAIALDKAREAAQHATDVMMAPQPLDVRFDELNQFWTKQATEITEWERRVNDAAADMGFTFQSAFEDAALAGEEFSDVLKALAEDIGRIILRLTVTRPLAEGIAGSISGAGLGTLLAGMFGSGGGGAEQLSGPGMQHGGPVSAGRPYVVGEAGPELFIPGRSGTIVPNGAGGVTINQGPITVNGPGVTVAEVRAALREQHKNTIAAVRELQRR